MEKAKSLYLEALEIQERVIGKAHRNYGESKYRIALIYWDLGQFDEAISSIKESVENVKSNIISASHHLSEQELSLFILKFRKIENSLLCMNQKQPWNDDLSKICFDNILFYKGFLLNAAQQSRRLISGNPEAVEKYIQLQKLSRNLVAEYAKPISERKDVSKMEELSNSIEKDLARIVRDFSDTKKQIDFQTLSDKLNKKESIVEFIHYGALDDDSSLEINYAAQVLGPGNKYPQFVYLCTEKQISDMIGLEKSDQSVAAIYGTRGVTPHLVPHSDHSLYELLWKPLDSLLKGVKTIYYSPSGILNKVNFDAIQLSDRKWLSDQYNLMRLGSSRTLMVQNIFNIGNYLGQM